MLQVTELFTWISSIENDDFIRRRMSIAIKAAIERNAPNGIYQMMVAEDIDVIDAAIEFFYSLRPCNIVVFGVLV